ncbi:hypothetical protein ACLB2K_073827 [Fragaria x ananassa]
MEETKQRSQEEKRKEFEHRIMTGCSESSSLDFEEDFGGVSGARNVYERGIESYEKIIDHDHIKKSKARAEVKDLLVAFAEFEVRCNEIDRARCVYKRVIDYWPLSNFLYFKIMSFKNQYGDEDIDDLIERKRCYEQGRIED